MPPGRQTVAVTVEPTTTASALELGLGVLDLTGGRDSAFGELAHPLELGLGDRDLLLDLADALGGVL